jgi:hypothetical protein
MRYRRLTNKLQLLNGQLGEAKDSVEKEQLTHAKNKLTSNLSRYTTKKGAENVKV